MAKQAKKTKAKGGKRREKRSVPHGLAHIQATFNNTLVTISDPEGNVVTWSSAGRIGFKGSRKGTPFAAQVAGSNAAQQARDYGVRSVDVQVKGPGSGRESAGAPGLGDRGQVDQGRHPDPPQRLPAQEAPARVGRLNRGGRPDRIGAASHKPRPAVVPSLTLRSVGEAMAGGDETWHVTPDPSAGSAAGSG